MVTSSADTVQSYLTELPEDRRAAITRVRSLIKKNLPPGFLETMQYGMISYVVPLSRYPVTPNGQPLAVAALASQKNHMAIYLMGITGSSELRSKFESAYKASGKRLDAGQSCVRFKRLDDLALDAIGDALGRVSVDALIAMTEAAQGGKKAKAKPAKATPAKATPAKAEPKTAPAKPAKSKPAKAKPKAAPAKAQPAKAPAEAKPKATPATTKAKRAGS